MKNNLHIKLLSKQKKLQTNLDYISEKFNVSVKGLFNRGWGSGLGQRSPLGSAVFWQIFSPLKGFFCKTFNKTIAKVTVAKLFQYHSLQIQPRIFLFTAIIKDFGSL